ncbi:MAG: PrsW family glutamic-type intramembrane protease [Actinomycetota bacterium]|nr:PrsW family glutamic-type intramembrane protease [Actinomycetota bacterium]
MIALFNNPGFYVTYALVQAIVVLLLIRLLDPYERESLSVLVVMALWGGTGAALISVAGNRALRSVLSPDAQVVFGNAVSAPVVEEAAKGLALLAVVGPLGWIAKRMGVGLIDGLTDGIVYGAAVGLGFGFTEDFFYFVDQAKVNGLQSGLDVFVYRRDFFGPAVLHHPLFTAAFGAGLGMAVWSVKRAGKILYPLAGYLLAVLMHAVNNGLTELVLVLKYGLKETAAWSRGMSADLPIDHTAGTLTSFLRVIDIWWFALFFAAIALWIYYQRGIIRKELAEEVGNGLLTHDEWSEMFRPLKRSARYRRLLRSGQLEQWRRTRRVHRELVALALLKWNTRRTGGDWERVQRARREISTLATFQARPSNLPASTTPLVGREHELAAVQELVSEPEIRFVTLTGAGGTGKTRLAIAAAEKLGDSFGGGVFFVSLAPIRDPDLVLPAIAQALGVEERAGESLLDSLKDTLRDKQLLLVLDGFEYLLDAAPLVAELLDAAPSMTVLATSRERLRIEGEHEFPVPPLSLPEPGAREVTAVSQAGAVALFVHHARAADPQFELTAENAADVAEVCRRVDGLPLAIELAAARVAVISPREMLERLEDPLDVLEGGGRDLEGRHQTLRATIDWSYQTLEAPEQALFARLAVFDDGFRLEGAEAVSGEGSGDLLDTLGALVDKSLVRRAQQADGEPRFVMLETIRDYALERLQESSELAKLRERHARYFLEYVEAAEPELTGADQEAWLRRVDEEEANIRAVLEWSAETGELDLGLRVAGALVRHRSARGRITEARAWLEKTLAAGRDVPIPTLAKGYFAFGYAALEQSDYDAAKASFEQSLALAEQADDGQRRAASLAQLAWIAGAEGDHDRAQTLAQESLDLAQKAGDGHTASGALNVLAECAAVRGEADRARQLFEQSLTLRRELADQRLIANSLLNIGRFELARGENERAAPLLEEALALARALGDTWNTAVALASLGSIRLAKGDHDEARVLYAEALRLARERRNRLIVSECLEGLAAVSAADDQPQRAARLFGAAAALSEQIGVELSPVQSALGERFLPRVREALGEDAFDAEWTVGQALSEDEAIATALETPGPKTQGPRREVEVAPA